MKDCYEVLCYGDSNTWGCIPRWEESALPSERYDAETRWPKSAQKILGAGFHMIGEGLNGRTTVYDRAGAAYKNGLTHLTPCLISHRPLDLVILLLGTNDLFLEIQPPLARLGDGIRKLAQTVTDCPSCGRDGNAPKILIISPAAIKQPLGRAGRYAEFGGETGGRLSRAFGDVYEAAALETGCFFLRGADFASPSDADGIHWTAESHLALGAAVAEKLCGIFGE
ncbi:MAG: GDSL-type esterase/lipase family protein [Oscillospiraceae bacterium]|jgi:lysophospholipase L1-like esterase|nr:GDSL-type esterase/lipase family protein [Oscillospiraceae bacterium]